MSPAVILLIVTNIFWVLFLVLVTWFTSKVQAKAAWLQEELDVVRFAEIHRKMCENAQRAKETSL